MTSIENRIPFGLPDYHESGSELEAQREAMADQIARVLAEFPKFTTCCVSRDHRVSDFGFGLAAATRWFCSIRVGATNRYQPALRIICEVADTMEQAVNDAIAKAHAALGELSNERAQEFLLRVAESSGFEDKAIDLLHAELIGGAL